MKAVRAFLLLLLSSTDVCRLGFGAAGFCQKSLDEKLDIFSGLVPSPITLYNSSTNTHVKNCFTTKAYSQDGHNNLQVDNNVEDGAEAVTTSDFCFPSILIAGFPKCATSFLFHALSEHPQILPTRRKELCLGGPLSETWPKLVSYLPSILDTESAGAHHVMTGCLHLGANIKATKELCIPPTHMKVIFLIRDVADMLWAAYNYWCNVATDGPSCFPGKHTQPGEDIRTPSLFHTRIKEGLPMGGGYALSSQGMCYRKDIQKAIKVFGLKNVLVIKSENVLDETRKPEVLQNLMNFLELLNSDGSTEWLRHQVSSSYIINSGSVLASKGVHKKMLKNSTFLRKGLYEASHYQPMLEETRLLIYQKWRKECRYLRAKFNIQYEYC